ncbi:MAG: hypothetical protein ABWY08_10430 [Comamonas sp.]
MNRHLCAAALAMGLATGASGQWSTDPQKNAAVAETPGGAQIQPQIAPAADGQWWISWFGRQAPAASQGAARGAPHGYGMYLQRLGADGQGHFAPPGLEVAGLGLDWIEKHGLAVDGQGHALLAFQDDRKAAPARAITATRIDSEGQASWTALAADTGHAPQIAALPGAQAVVGWSAGAELAVHLRLLDAAGQPVWRSATGAAQDVVLGEPGANYALADLQAAADGAVIVSFVRSRDFSGPRHLYANKISAHGELLWGPNHVKVFDGGTLQHGAWPRFVPDDSGGAVFAWASVAPRMQVYAQHVQANGQPAFAPGGVAVSTDLKQARVQPSVSWQADSGEITLFWIELDSAARQHLRGLYAQKIDARGARQWGETGLVLHPLGRDGVTDPRSTALADGTLVFWMNHAPTGQTTSIQGIKLDATGAPLCAQFAVSTRATAKSRLASATAPAGQTLLAWEEHGLNADATIYTQGVRPDCQLGGQ